MENGDTKLAGTEKSRLEEKQRGIRRYREKNGIEETPVYFKLSAEENGNPHYEYLGGYWEDRKKGDWSKLPDIYGEDFVDETTPFKGNI